MPFNFLHFLAFKVILLLALGMLCHMDIFKTLQSFGLLGVMCLHAIDTLA